MGLTDGREDGNLPGVGLERDLVVEGCKVRERGGFWEPFSSSIRM